MGTEKPNQMFLVVLSGGGDTEVKIVSKPVWDWILTEDDFQGEDSIQDTPPPEVIQEMIEENGEDSDCTVFVTSGSPDNDRALNAPAPNRSFFSMKEALQYIKRNNIEIVEEYEGYIY